MKTKMYKIILYWCFLLAISFVAIWEGLPLTGWSFGDVILVDPPHVDFFDHCLIAGKTSKFNLRVSNSSREAIHLVKPETSCKCVQIAAWPETDGVDRPIRPNSSIDLAFDVHVTNPVDDFHVAVDLTAYAGNREKFFKKQIPMRVRAMPEVWHKPSAVVIGASNTLAKNANSDIDEKSQADSANGSVKVFSVYPPDQIQVQSVTSSRPDVISVNFKHSDEQYNVGQRVAYCLADIKVRQIRQSHTAKNSDEVVVRLVDGKIERIPVVYSDGSTGG